jgi:hypothetical protein
MLWQVINKDILLVIGPVSEEEEHFFEMLHILLLSKIFKSTTIKPAKKIIQQ